MRRVSVVIVVDGVDADRFVVTVSPSAELAASLHVLTEHGHHTEHVPWVRKVLADAPAAFLAGLQRFSPLWTALRWRGFYPGPGTPPAPLSDRRFAELTAYACVSGYHGFDFSRVLDDPRQATALRHGASRLPEPHPRLAEDLLRDAARLRADVAAFLDLCRPVFFDELWPRVQPDLVRAAHRVRHQLADAGPAAALLSLSPSSARLHTPATGPARVVFDKVHHAVVSPARTTVLLVPTRFGTPHLLVKNEPGLPAVVHFPVDAPDVGVTLARNRLLALTDPHRVRLCRLIARQAMTTADLADRLAMTRPQVSRHLRALRDLELVRTERHGRQVHYRLDLDAVARIGHDVATALQH
jgi:DNA-binding transcriptional ArsR family regulator